MFVNLLIWSCLRDDFDPLVPVVEVSITPEEALGQFSKTYKPGQDALKDRIMEGLLQLNESQPLVHNLVARYGVPRWDSDRTTPDAKSDQMLLLPLQGEHADSLALMVFISTPDAGIRYKIFEANTSDTLVSDIMLYYRMQYYPEGDYSQRYVIQGDHPDKGDIVVTSCLWVYIRSGDGSETLSYVTCRISVEKAFWNTADSGGSSGGTGGLWNDLPTDGGGNGGDPPPPPPPPSSCPTGLLVEEHHKVQKEIDAIQLLSHCMTNRMLDAVVPSARFFKDACQQSLAYYIPGSNEIYFRNEQSITEWSVFEELTHNFQDNFYSGGVSQYGPGKPGNTNMEFEAKLLHAIFHFENGTSNSWLQHVFNSQQEWDDIRDWLENYIDNGLTTEFFDKYDYYLNIFSSKTDYGGFVSVNFPKMTFIELLRNQCN